MDTRYSIGDLARLTGLTVKAIRFYSDRGIVPPAGRSPAGYRRYGVDAVARLELVRTLRELGLDLATVRKVVDRELSLPEVARAHAEALAAQIRTLRLRHAVLTAVARRGAEPEETDLMHRLATLSAAERRHLVQDFLDAAFGDLDPGIVRSHTPELPDDPEPEQVEAWLELAELSRDPDFRALMRRLADHLGTSGPQRDVISRVRDLVKPFLDLDPTSPEAAPIAARIKGLQAYLEAANDPRRERYLRLLAVVNSWAPPDTITPELDWALEALVTHRDG